MTSLDLRPGAPRVLIVDDEPMVREVLGRYLQKEGFAIEEAADGGQAIEAIEADDHEMILLDLMLPVVAGIDVLRSLRRTSSTPVIILSALGDELDRVRGLELGADDYVVKPFSSREVVARVRSVLRRFGTDHQHRVLTFGSVVIDNAAQSVTRDGEPVEFTRKEFALLTYLVRRPEEVVTRSELVNNVWESSLEWQNPATVTVHVSRLRQKLEVDPAAPVHFVTEFGVGYRFVP